MLPPYHFGDIFRDDTINDKYVTVEGTWISDTKLADPIQTTKLECWRDFGYCIDNTARISNGYLHIDTTLHKISSWIRDEIRCEENESALCTTYSLIIDRKNSTVTNVRNTKKPKPKGCEWIQDEPIFMHLGDIYTKK